MITKEQLDELEAKANQRPKREPDFPKELHDAIVRPVEVPPDVTLQLVAIARAALAWSEAKDARQAVQVRAGTAETSAEHSAAMAELPAAKEAEVLATMALKSALEAP